MENDVFNRLLQTHIEKIRKAKRNNKLVVFVGSGVSANSKLPTWYELVSQFSQEIGVDLTNSLESFLQIPQYYFNERGEKEYYDKVFEVFGRSNYKPNPIHRQILSLNPRHIITTNYDDLIEKSTKLHNKSYHVVATNSDLPYASQDQMIIKMHGCLNKKNIVLKEDDYLNYSKNFKLIETFVKSLFSTHVVLFVGFSADDPNFKLIFQWVKDILASDFQPAYLIDVNEEFNLLKYNYYKNRGINTIYVSNIKEKDIETIDGEIKIEHEKGRKLYSLLHSINNIEKNVNEVIDNLYQGLKELDHFNVLLPKVIIKKMDYQQKAIFDFKGDSKIYLLNREDPLTNFLLKLKGVGEKKAITKRFRRDILRKQKDKLKYIIKTLKKANVSGIHFSGMSDEYSFRWKLDYNYSTYPKLEFAFDLKGILEERIKQSRIPYYDPKPSDRMLNSFLNYKSNNISKANEILNELSRMCFENKEYTNYYLVEFNKKHIQPLKRRNFLIDEEDDFSEIKEKEKAKDLDNLNLDLPVSEREKPAYIQEIISFNFIYSNLHKNRELLRKILKTKEFTEQGGSSVSPDLRNIYNNTYNFWNFISSNYLMVEHYTEVKSIYLDFVESILINYSIKLPEKSAELGLSTYKLSHLNQFMLFIMIAKITNKELNIIFSRHRITKVEVDNDTKQYILKGFSNFVQSYLDENVRKQFYNQLDNILNNYLLLFSVINFNDDDLSSIFDNISDVLNHNVNYDFYKYFGKFVTALNNRKIVLKDESVINIVENVIQRLINNDLGQIEKDAIEKSVVFYNLTELVKGRSPVKLFNSYLFSYLIETVDRLILTNSSKDGLNIINSFILPLNGLVEDEDITAYIKEIILRFDINHLDFDELELLLVVIHNSIMDSVIVIDLPTIKLIIDIFKKVNGNTDLVKIIKETFIYPIRDNKIALSCLPKELWGTISNDSLEFFLLVPDYVDYKKFDINWLNYLNDSEHESYSKVVALQTRIKEIVKQADLCELNNNLLNIVIKYYLVVE